MNVQQAEGRSHDIFAGAIPAEVARAYQKLSRAGGVSDAEAAAFVGGEHIRRQLLDRGLAITPNAAGKFTAAPPRMALLSVANQAHKNLSDMTQMVRDLVCAAYKADDAPPPGTALDGLFEFYTDRDEIIAVSTTLINSTHREWLALDNLHRESYLTEGSRIDGLKTTRDSVTRRCIYDRAFMREPVGRQIIRDSIAAGEHARLYPGIGMKMQIADTSAALLPCSLSGMSGAVLIRAEPIIRGLHQLFELLWDKAVPAFKPPAEDNPLTRQKRKILGLLAQGLRADDIAKQTGLTESAVRKHITTINKRLHVTSPFQAGVEAHRHGWVALSCFPCDAFVKSAEVSSQDTLDEVYRESGAEKCAGDPGESA